MSELLKEFDSKEVYRRLMRLLSELPRAKSELELLKSSFEVQLNERRLKYIAEGKSYNVATALARAELKELEEEVGRLEAKVKELESEQRILSRLIELVHAEVLRLNTEVKALRLDIDGG